MAGNIAPAYSPIFTLYDSQSAWLLMRNYLFLVLAPVFSKMANIKCNVEEDGDMVKTEFNRFIENVANAMSEKNEQEELNIMKQS